MGTSPVTWSTLCRGSGFDEFRERLNGLFYPAEVTSLSGAGAGAGSGSGGAGGELRGIRMEHLTLGLMTFGQTTRVDPGRTWSYYHVNVVLKGRIAAASGRQESVATTGGAMAFTPTRHHRLLSCEAGAQQLGIKIDRRVVEAELEALLGRQLQAPLEFELDFDLSSPAGRGWRGVLDLLVAEGDRADGLISEPAVRAHYERLLVSGLLLAHTHNYTEELRRPGPPVYPRTIRRVVELLEAHPEDPYTLSDLARIAETSARRLQEAFQQHLGVSPMTYLRNLRLDRVHADLLTGTASVTESAQNRGFTHLSRFAAAYRARFGVFPSATLSESRTTTR